METANANIKSSLKDALETFKYVFTKPGTKALEKAENFKDAKVSGIFSGIAVVAYVIISLISAMISTVVVKSYFTGKTNVVFENLKNFDFLKNLGDNLLYTALAIAIVAAVVYVMGLIFKKQPNFMKLLGVVALGFAPAVCAAFVGNILAYFWSPLGMFATGAGLALMISFVVTAINKEIALEGDKKIFFHVATVTVIYVIAYLIVTNVLKTSILGGLGF
jgi:hypothetical protein